MRSFNAYSQCQSICIKRVKSSLFSLLSASIIPSIFPLRLESLESIVFGSYWSIFISKGLDLLLGLGLIKNHFNFFCFSPSSCLGL